MQLQPNAEVSGDNTPRIVETAVGKTADGQRSGVWKDIEQTMGIVPGFFKMLPQTHLHGEWRIFKEFQFGDQTALDPKTKELIGLAVASVLHCKYCTYFHTIAAGIHGATAQELNEALLMAKHTASWSTYLTGARYDLDQLKQELEAVKRHLTQQKPARS